MSSTSTHKDTQSLEINDGQPAVRKIIHVDMDAFYASVEQRDDPKLKGLPVIVGGKPNGRGVVAACSYEARKFGVRSAMPSAEAYRRCPQAVFVKSRFDAYKEASKQIHTVFNEFTDLVEPLSLDEAYLDVSNNTLFSGSAYRLAREIKTMIWERTQLVASAGVSYNKFLAKIASDYDKPDGIYCILPEDGESFVASLAVGRSSLLLSGCSRDRSSPCQGQSYPKIIRFRAHLWAEYSQARGNARRTRYLGRRVTA